MLFISCLLTCILCGVLDVQVANSIFSRDKAVLNVDDSLVFTVNSNTTLSLCEADCTLIGNPAVLTASGTFLHTFSEPGTVYMTAGDCTRKMEIKVNPFPTNPYIQRESLLLEQYEKQMQLIQAKAQNSASYQSDNYLALLVGCLVLIF